MVVLINWDKPSWNVLLSCSLISQLCVGGPDYSNCTVNSHAGIGIVKKIDFMMFITFAETIRTVLFGLRKKIFH